MHNPIFNFSSQLMRSLKSNILAATKFSLYAFIFLAASVSNGSPDIELFQNQDAFVTFSGSAFPLPALDQPFLRTLGHSALVVCRGNRALIHTNQNLMELRSHSIGFSFQLHPHSATQLSVNLPAQQEQLQNLFRTIQMRMRSSASELCTAVRDTLYVQAQENTPISLEGAQSALEPMVRQWADRVRTIPTSLQSGEEAVFFTGYGIGMRGGRFAPSGTPYTVASISQTPVGELYLGRLQALLNEARLINSETPGSREIYNRIQSIHLRHCLRATLLTQISRDVDHCRLLPETYAVVEFSNALSEILRGIQLEEPELAQNILRNYQSNLFDRSWVQNFQFSRTDSPVNVPLATAMHSIVEAWIRNIHHERNLVPAHSMGNQSATANGLNGLSNIRITPSRAIDNLHSEDRLPGVFNRANQRNCSFDIPSESWNNNHRFCAAVRTFRMRFYQDRAHCMTPVLQQIRNERHILTRSEIDSVPSLAPVKIARFWACQCAAWDKMHRQGVPIPSIGDLDFSGIGGLSQTQLEEQTMEFLPQIQARDLARHGGDLDGESCATDYHRLDGSIR